MSRILLDQNVPRRLGTSLRDRYFHQSMTAYDMGWSSTKDADLLTAAEAAGFSVLITCDQSIPYQQNLSGRSIATIVLPTNRWKVIESHLSVIADAIEIAKPAFCQILGPWRI